MRFSLINYLRGYSIFTIVLMHLLMGACTGVMYKAISFGGAGVHVFILCSGFGLYLSHLRRPLGYVDFLKRRFGKVWIPYAIAVSFWGIWYLISKGIFPIREVASHLLLYKMFSTELDTSLCYPYWFISTILQFYLLWPLIVKVFRLCGGFFIFLFISLAWSTIVGLLGLEEERPWGSFFLQYLWEFGLGMWIAKRCIKLDHNGTFFVNIKNYCWWWLIIGAVSGMGMSAFMAWNGGVLKLYNDIPSLIGYLSVALLIYKISVKMINNFFEWSNDFSYELYLIHSLVYTIIAYMLTLYFPLSVLLVVKIMSAYLLALGYKWFLNTSKLAK